MSELVGLQHFHGVICKRECRELLREPGDFLLRSPIMEFDKLPAPPDCVCMLTVGVAEDEAPTDEKNLPDDYSERLTCITRPVSYLISGKPDCCTFNNETFPSMQALCNSFVEGKKPLPNGGTLVRAVIRQSWQLLLSDIDFITPEVLLGKGSYGKVVKATMKTADGGLVNVAVKSTLEGADDVKFAEMYTEARSMRRMASHANIIELIGVVVEKLPIMLAIELFEGTSLLKALQGNLVPDHMRFPVIVGIMYGLVYMHSQYHIHRDIAARNVMVSPDCKQVKIIDFGLAKHGLLFRLTETQKVPKKWLAPEVIKEWTFSTKSDVWAFAVTIWEVYHNGAIPYTNVSKEVKSCGSQDKKNQKTTTNRRTKDKDELKITENVHLVPKPFLPIYDKMLNKVHRDRVEMGVIANYVEKLVIPTLPKESKDAAMIHQKNRPPFDLKFGLDSEAFNIASSDSNTDRKTPTPRVPSPASKDAVKPSDEKAKRSCEKPKRSCEKPNPTKKTERRSKSKNKK